MLKTEKNYDFRKRMCNLHERIEVKDTVPECDEYVFGTEARLALNAASAVAKTAAKDFCAFMKAAFGLRIELVKDGEADIKAFVGTNNLKDAAGYAGRRITADKNGVILQGFDERGLAQAFYDLESALKERKAPYIKFCDTERRPAFSPRMIHSGYGLDEYPDQYLSVCAHYGYDAVIVFMKDATHSTQGEIDLNDIIKRAAVYGIDVYAYSYIINFIHPEAENAKEIYAAAYGSVFKQNKGLKGMIFVGESIEFPSKDKKVSPRHYYEVSPDGIPDGRVSPGWWPCEDYPEWISLVRDSIRHEAPNADVVFWTYNFGYVDEAERVKLLKNVPTDISLLVTYEMFDKYKLENATEIIMDYTASYVGPGKYFESEAKVAKERGIKLYAQANTAGRTWDYGVAPYEPFPYQWQKRFDKLNESREKYGLCGLMEGHHYGFSPSFISELAKEAFTIGGKAADDALLSIAKRYSAEEYEKVLECFKLWSESITKYTATDEEQYGPFRVGPAYPMCLIKQIKLPNTPDMHFGNAIYDTLYHTYDLGNQGSNIQKSCYGIREGAETRALYAAERLVYEGIKILKSIKEKNDALLRLINLGEFIRRSNLTAISAKKLFKLRLKLLLAETPQKVEKLIKEVERLGEREIANAKATIPLVKRDSELGFEPTMLYQCDEHALLWKIKQVNYMLNVELEVYRKGAKC